MHTFGRRQFLTTMGACTAGMFLQGRSAWAAKPAAPFPMGKADHCIMLWLGGGACHQGLALVVVLEQASGRRLCRS